MREEEQKTSEYLESDPYQALFTHEDPDGITEPSVHLGCVVVIGKVLVVV